jgi:putative hemolysin
LFYFRDQLKMEKKKTIDLRRLIASKNEKLLRWMPGFVLRYLERVIHQDEINTLLEKAGELKDAEFSDAAMEEFNITISSSGLENIPKTGPLIIVLNHPLGGMDALALISLLKNHRSDLRFIVNDILMNIENLSGLFIGINKHGINKKNVREDIEKAFKSEHAICIFPAGLVSRKINGIVQDLEWKRTFVTYARSLDRTVIPIKIDGQLSPFFYRLSRVRRFFRIKANIEMLYLADELFKQRNKTLTYTVGQAIKMNQFDISLTDKEVASEIRKIVHELRP